MELNNGGDSADWFFLAMAYCQLDEKQLAFHWYDQALQQIQKGDMTFEPLSRYKEEAEKLLHSRTWATRRKDKDCASE
jgi:hypothetical protein